MPEAAVPAHFVAERPKRTDDAHKPIPSYLDTLKYQEVEVLSQGITYRGTFLGHDGTELHLRTPGRYIILPMELVSRIRPVGSLPQDRDED